MDKIDALVEWVAKTIWEEDSGDAELWVEYGTDYIRIAKQILSHPDLHLVYYDSEGFLSDVIPLAEH